MSFSTNLSTNSLALSKPPSKNIAPISASNASDVTESRFLPPYSSSPFPRYKKSPRLISLASLARVPSHTRLALSRVIFPSGIS